MLKHAKSLGHLLIVGLNSDNSVKLLKGPTRPINNQENRKKILEELRCVDFVQIFNSTSCEDFLNIVKPDIYFKSGDYKIESLNTKEKYILEKHKTKILFGKMVPNISTTKIFKLL
jgi:rfaE bifunctional protein nucleotidyltransferase chain/domain